MRRLPLLFAALVFLVSSTAFAAPARGEGLLFRLDSGFVVWSFDRARVESQLGSAPPGDFEQGFLQHTPEAPTAALELGYNFGGHLTLALSMTAAGWDIGSKERGGAGLAAALLSWHPLQLVDKPSYRNRRWDFSLLGGGGYAIVGEQRALDGAHVQFGGRLEYFANDWVSIGASVRGTPFFFSRYVRDWNKERAISLPRNSGGIGWFPSITFAVHAPFSERGE